MDSIEDFFLRQLEKWPLAVANYQSQQKAVYKDFVYSDCCRIRLVCLPERMVSSSANITAKGEVNRPCFLCPHRLPPEQIGWRKGDFQLLVNPFPVFPRHFTLAAIEHQPQVLFKHFDTLFEYARLMPRMVLFFNGAACGASAPDHLHFQAGNKGYMPIECDYGQWRSKLCQTIYEDQDLCVCELSNMLRSGWLIESSSKDSIMDVCHRLIQLMQELSDQTAGSIDTTLVAAENRINLLCWFDEDKERYRCLLFPRQRHRPHCFYAEGEKQRITSPASVEMGGYYIFPRREDFERISPEEVAEIYAEVCLPTAEVSRLSEAFVQRFTPSSL